MAFKPRLATKDAKESRKAPYVLIATPAYDGRVYTDYAISIAETARDATAYGIRVGASIMGNGAFIDLARNTLVKMFLDDPDYTHLFFVDADLKWESRLFVGLVLADLPICAGAYPKRQDPEEYPMIMEPDAEGGVQVDNNGFILCKRVATGFLCIRRDVIEMMVAQSPRLKLTEGYRPRLFYTKNEPIEGEEHTTNFIGEDFTFSDDYVRMTGNLIPVYPDAEFTHAKQWTGNWHKFLVKQSESETARIAAEQAASTSAAA